MPLITVFLTAGSQAELQQVHEDFFAHIASLDKSAADVADITVLNDKDVKALCSGKDPDPAAVVKALETYVTSKKPKASKKKEKKKKKRVSIDNTTPLKIILLSGYPDTVDQFRAIVESTRQHPVVDSVIRLVMRAPGEDLVTSDSGPDTTLKNDFEKLKIEASGSASELKSISNSMKSNLVDDLDIEEFLLSTRDFHGGGVTVDELNGFRMATQDEAGGIEEGEGEEHGCPLVPREMADIYSDFTRMCQTLAALKENFFDWAGGVKTVSVKYNGKAVKRARDATATVAVTQPEGVWKKEPLYNAYQGYANLLPGDCQSAGGVLYSMMQALVHTTEKDDKTDVFNSVDFTSFDFNNVQLPKEGDATHQSFARNSSSAALLEGVMRHAHVEESSGGSDLMVVEEGDNNAYRSILASRYLSVADDPSRSVVNASAVTDASLSALDEGSLSLPTQNACAGLVQFENEAIYRAQVPRLLGQGGLPLVPAISPIERNIQESELLTFSSFSAHDIHRFNMLKLFDEMLQNSIPRLANFTGQQIGATVDDASITKRKYFRHIPGFTLPQIIARDLDTEPVVIREYYPMTDQLLLGVLWIPPSRRMGLKEWTPNLSMHTKPTYEQYLVMNERQNFTPRTLGALRTSINVSKGEMDKYRQETCVITPSDKSMVTSKLLSSTSESWLSVHLDKTMFGLRLTPKLAGSSEKGGKVLKKLASQMDTSRSGEGSSASLRRTQSTLEPPRGGVGSPLKRMASHAVERTDDDQFSEMSGSISSLDCSQEKGYFVCHTEDNVRISASILSKSRENRKPDGKCFMKMNMTFPNGMVSRFGSDGVVCFYSPPKLRTPKSTNIEENASVRHSYGCETSRHCVSGGVVTRHLDNSYLFRRDVLMPDGTRVLIRGDEPVVFTKKIKRDSEVKGKNGTSSKKKNTGKKSTNSKLLNKQSSVAIAEEALAKERARVCPDPFLLTLLQSAPLDWRYARLEVSGEISYFNGEPGSTEGTIMNGRVEPDACSPTNIRSSYIDAETKSEVFEYRDGRILTLWANDDLREVRFPDGTRTVTHLKTNSVFVEKADLPSIEYDVDVDRVSRKHSLGLQVPIAKGGERTRCRVSMPDGTAVFIKYNTKITARYNGSIKTVLRNHEVILAEDGGVVTYHPSSAWSRVSEKEFATDSFDEAVAREEQYKSRQNTENLSVRTSPASRGKKIRFRTEHSPDAQSIASTAMTSVTRATIATGSPSRKSAGPGPSSLKSKSEVSASSTMGKDPFFAGPGGPSDSVSIGSIDSLVKQQASQNSTTYTFNLTFLSCVINDHENNIFELELSRPMDPYLQLAGEIDDLKPKAISESATEPRMFIVNRDGNATEVMRNDAVTALNDALDTSPDMTKQVMPAEHLSCDLGNTSSHSFFTSQRSSRPGGIAFQEVFGRRYWHNYTPPTVAAIKINRRENARVPAVKLLDPPKIFETQVMTEHAPLSAEGYVQLASEMASWQQWRAKRVQAMGRYAFVDPRSSQEIDADKEMSAKVKKAYKAAKNKAAVLRKKEKERERLQMMASASHEMACVEEVMDEVFSSDEEEEEFTEDPETLEVVEAFNTYSVEFSTPIGIELKIPLEDCRPALVQVLNRFVSMEDIYNVLNDDSKTSLTLEQFRRVYFVIKNPSSSPAVSVSSEGGELRRATITNSVPLLSTSLSLHSLDCGDGDGAVAAGSALQAARLSKTSAQ